MGITLTPIAYTLRSGEKHEKHGDEWEFVATVLRVGRLAYIEGGRGELPSVAEMKAALKEAGFTHAKWVRIDGDEIKTNLVQL